MLRQTPEFHPDLTNRRKIDCRSESFVDPKRRKSVTTNTTPLIPLVADLSLRGRQNATTLPAPRYLRDLLPAAHALLRLDECRRSAGGGRPPARTPTITALPVSRHRLGRPPEPRVTTSPPTALRSDAVEALRPPQIPQVPGLSAVPRRDQPWGLLMTLDTPQSNRAMARQTWTPWEAFASRPHRHGGTSGRMRDPVTPRRHRAGFISKPSGHGK